MPFRDRNDLERHVGTRHGDTKPFVCPYHSCEASTRAFARKDKWLKHIRETLHENDPLCPFLHCNAKQIQNGTEFTSRQDIVKHFTKFHARNFTEGYECRLGSCSKSGDNNWSYSAFLEHLSKAHALFRHEDVCCRIILAMSSQKTLTKELLLVIFSKLPRTWANEWNESYHDCDICVTGSSHA